MSNLSILRQREFLALLGLLLVYGIAVSWTLPGKYPWHDEITTLRDSRESFEHLAKTYYTHKAYILASKACTSLWGESFTVLRIPSIAMGGLSLIAIYWLGSMLFRPAVGILAAAYLLLHPSFLFFSADARGYQGAFLFSILAAAFLWRGLSKVTIFDCLMAALSLFLGLMMQPTAALTYPGMMIMSSILIVKTYRNDHEDSRLKKKKLSWILGVSLIAGLILIGPRVWDYIRWDTLLIPSRFTGEGDGEGVSSLGPGPLRTLEGWRIHLAPLISAELHTGRIVTLGVFLLLIGALLPERGKRLQSLLLFLSFLSPFAFFVFYNPPFLVQRYLYAATPFAILLIVYGTLEIARRLSLWFGGIWHSRVQGVTLVGLMACLLWNCWGPFRAEISYSEYGSTWMVPVSELAQEDFMAEKILLLVDEKPLWYDQLEMLETPASRLSFYSPSENSGYDSLLEQLEDRTWVVLKSYSQDSGLQNELRKAGRSELRIEQGSFYLPSSDIGSATQFNNSLFYQSVRFLEDNFKLDFRFFYSVAQILKSHGMEEASKPYESRGMEGMAKMNRWDYPRTFGAFTSALGDYALSRDEPVQAAHEYAHAFGKPQSRFFDYVAFVDKVPGEARNKVVRSWGFDPDDFARGFIEALDRGAGLEEDYKAYWSFKGAQVLDQNGYLDEAWILYDYSIDHGDSLGRGAQRLFQFYLSGGDYLSAASVYLRGFGGSTTPHKNYIDFFEAIPKDHWGRVTELDDFDPKDYSQGLIDALNRDETLTQKQRKFWADRIGNILEELEFSDEGRKLKNAFPGE